MSTINQMLLDLEKRRAPRPEGVLSQARGLPARKNTIQAQRVVLFIAFLVIVIAAFAWLMLREAAPTPVIANTSIRTPAPTQATTPVFVAPITKTATVEETPVETPEVVESLLAPVSRLSLELGNPPTELESQQSVSSKPVTIAKPVKEPAVARKPKKAVVESSPQEAINKQVRQETAQQQAENEYRKAAAFLQQGKMQEAEEGFREALRLNPSHVGSRQTLAALLLQEKHVNDAENVLREGLNQDSKEAGLAMLLARIQIEKGETADALQTLERTLPYAAQNADYHAFLAALLQRESRHGEAVEQYQAALQLKPAGAWYMGLGISLQAMHRLPEAQNAFQQAMATGALNPDLQAFVEQRLRQIQK